MSAQEATPPAETAPAGASPEALRAAFDRLKAAYRKDGPIPYKERMRLLKALKGAILSRKEALCAALTSDFGNRARAETLLAEVFMVVESIRHTRAHLQDWVED